MRQTVKHTLLIYRESKWITEFGSGASETVAFSETDSFNDTDPGP